MKALKNLEDGSQGRPRMAVQGPVYLIGGLWPILHYQSFSRTLKPAADPRTVKAMGGIFALVGGVLVLAGVRAKRAGQPIAPASAGTATLLSVVEVFTTFRGRIPPLGLAQSAIELAGAVKRVTEKPQQETPPEVANRQPLPPDLA